MTALTLRTVKGTPLTYEEADANLTALDDSIDAVVNSVFTINTAGVAKLSTPRNIAGVPFDGTANINIPFANLSTIPTTLQGYGITDAFIGLLGTAFPTANLKVGMFYLRTDQFKLYQLKDLTPTWVMIADLLTPTPKFGGTVGTGVLDWNDNSNCIPGMGPTLLKGDAANGPGPADYFHTFNFEHTSSNGSGNIAQLAIPYGATGGTGAIYMRGRFNGVWTAWTRQLSTNDVGSGKGLDADMLDGQHGSYYAPINNAGLTGIPTAPTAAPGTNTTQLANTAFVFSAVAAGVASVDFTTLLPLNGTRDMTGILKFSNASMYITHYDTDWANNRHIHSNGGTIGFLGSDSAWKAYSENGGNWVASGNVIAYSDIRVKTNIVKIENALSKVQQLNGYTFDRTDMECARQTGLIAQEVEAVLPEAVSESRDGILGVAYGNIVGLLVEAIKEQQQQINELKQLIAN